MYVCMYAWMDVCMYIYVNIYMDIYVCILYANIKNAHIYIRIFKCICMLKRVYIQSYRKYCILSCYE